MKSIFRFLFVFVFAVLVGCVPAKNKDTEIKKAEAAGWTFHEHFGPSDKGAAPVFEMSSPTARRITAFANDGTNRLDQNYDQSEYVYYVVTMQNLDDTLYALVFRKKN